MQQTKGLIRREHRDLLRVEHTPTRLLALLAADMARAQPTHRRSTSLG